MSISREEAHTLNPIICDKGSDGTFYRMDDVLKHLQTLCLESAHDGIDNDLVSAIFYIFGCVRGAIHFETEVATDSK